MASTHYIKIESVYDLTPRKGTLERDIKRVVDGGTSTADSTVTFWDPEDEATDSED